MAHGNSKPKSLAWRISWSVSRSIHGKVCGRKSAFKTCTRCQPMIAVVMGAINAHETANPQSGASRAA